MKLQTLCALIIAPALLLLSNGAAAQTTDAAPSATSAVPADNTRSNSQDPSNRAATADDQKNDTSDLQITQEIRRSVMADKSLSTYAHNAKIVTVNGTVTLNGVVHTDAEKASLADKASQVVGSGRVVNDLKVAPAEAQK
jgi:osmotically-inducible protein OsmY